jgi:hypothetical protein
MSTKSKLVAAFCGSVSAMALGVSGASAASAPQPLPAKTSACGATAAVTVTPPVDVKCINVIQVPGNKLNSFDISWVNAFRAEMYLADRSNAGIDVINTTNLTYKRRLTGFVGIKTSSPVAINNNVSGPNGVVSHNRWLYAGDGNSTLRIYDLNSASDSAAQVVSTIDPSVTSVTRVDEMDLTPDGSVLIASNNIEDPPFSTQFAANGDSSTSDVVPTIQWSVDPLIIPSGAGLSLEQARWDPYVCSEDLSSCGRFVVSIPIINSNFFPNSANGSATPTCNYGQLTTAITCDGGFLVINPFDTTSNTVAPSGSLDTPPPGVIQVALTAWDPVSATGVIPMTHFTFAPPPSAGVFYNGCSPNGVHFNPFNGIIAFACTPGNNPSDIVTGAIQGTELPTSAGAATTLTWVPGTTPEGNNFPSPGVTGGDELWFNFADCTLPMIVVPTPPKSQCSRSYGDQRFYVAASKNNTYKDTLSGFPNGTATGAPTNGPVLGVLGGALKSDTNIGYNALPLLGTIPVSSGGHSVAADAIRNYIFAAQVAPLCKTAGCNTNVVGNLNVIGGDTTGNKQSTSNSQLLCGTANGCIAVFHSSGQGNTSAPPGPPNAN